MLSFSGLNEKLRCYKESDTFGTQISHALAITEIKTICVYNYRKGSFLEPNYNVSENKKLGD